MPNYFFSENDDSNQNTLLEINSLLLSSLFFLYSYAIWRIYIKKKLINNSPADYGGDDANAFLGALTLYTKTCHGANKINFNLPKDGNYLVAVGPHTNGMLDAALVIATIPRTLTGIATTYYNFIPGVDKMLDAFNAIKVRDKSDPKWTQGEVVGSGIQGLRDGKHLVIFPQGQMIYEGDKQKIRIKRGAAIMAKESKRPIVVLQLKSEDGIILSLLPSYIKHNRYFKAFLSLMLCSKSTVTHYATVTDHLDNSFESKQHSQGFIDNFENLMNRCCNGMLPQFNASLKTKQTILDEDKNPEKKSVLKPHT